MANDVSTYTEGEIGEEFRKMNSPESGLRELVEWRRRDGEGPVPSAVREVAQLVNEHSRKTSHLREK